MPFARFITLRLAQVLKQFFIGPSVDEGGGKDPSTYDGPTLNADLVPLRFSGDPDEY